MANNKLVINPWKSIDVKDYNKLMKDFGIKKINPKNLPDNLYFRRGIIFGEKSLNLITVALEKNKPFVMMTGLMPSGKFHFGHKIIADLMIYFQQLGAECYIAVADVEAYLTRGIPLDKSRELAINEYLINYIALGLKPEKTKFYFQSEGAIDYMNLSKYVSKKTTYNELKSIYGEITPEKIISAFTQVADILHPQLSSYGGPKPIVVPVGVDQLPHINLTRDIAGRMKSDYKFIPPSAIFTKLMPGLKGDKMSSSDPYSYIALSEDPKEAAKKIKKHAFSGGQATIEEHRKKGGNPDIDVAFQMLLFGLEPDDKKLQQIYNDYKSGKLLSGELKQITIDKMTTFLTEHQKKRVKAQAQVKKFMAKV